MESTSTTKFCWSVQAQHRLIDLVRDHPMLWDHRHELFKKTLAKKNQWREITSHIQHEFVDLGSLTADEVQSKFAKLKSSFLREARKVHCTPSGSSGGVRPKWEFFEALSYLLVLDKERQTSSSFTYLGGQENMVLTTVDGNIANPALTACSEPPASIESPPSATSSDPALQPLPSPPLAVSPPSPPPAVVHTSSTPSPQTMCNKNSPKRKRKGHSGKDVEGKVDDGIEAINAILGRHCRKPTLAEKVGTMITSYLSCLSEDKQKKVSAELIKVIEKQAISQEDISE